LAVDEGRHARAAELAREAFALDPERVMADPLVYKMHLLSVMQDGESCCPCDLGCKADNGAEQKKTAKAADHMRKVKHIVRQLVPLLPPLPAPEKTGSDSESNSRNPYILTDEATGEELQDLHEACRAAAKPYRAVIGSPAEEPFRAGYAKEGGPAPEAATTKDGGPAKGKTFFLDPVYHDMSELLPGMMQLEVDANGDQVRMLWQFPVGEHLVTVRRHRGQWSVSVRDLEKGN
jgi:hypothetical protein